MVNFTNCMCIGDICGLERLHFLVLILFLYTFLAVYFCAQHWKLTHLLANLMLFSVIYLSVAFPNWSWNQTPYYWRKFLRRCSRNANFDRTAVSYYFYRVGAAACFILKGLQKQKIGSAFKILGRELGPSGVSPNQLSRWKLAFSPLKHV